jgi:hypothetical protein
MKNFFPFFTRTFLVLTLIFTFNRLKAQSWLELREQGANFNEVKAAFERQYGSKVKKMNRELREEAKDGVGHTDQFERQMEGMIQYKRWAEFVEPRVRESNGEMSAMNRGISQAIADKARRAATTRTGASWSLIGPRNTPTNGGNGRINAVRAHPTIAGTLFGCAPAGGLFKSTDNGTNWTPISDGVAVMGATDVAFDRTNASTMYLATGDGEAGDAYSTGIYKSTDGGASWSATSLSFPVSGGKRISKIIVNPTDGSILAGGSIGIYRSTDNGGTWTQVVTTSVRDLEFKPGDPTVVYAGGYFSTTTTNPNFLRSTNGGVTWATAGTGLPTTNWQRVAVAVTDLDPTYVYALVSNTTDDGLRGIYLSTDGGTTFTSKATTPNILGWEATSPAAGGQGWYDLSIVVDPSVKTTIYMGGVNVWKSTTSGASPTCIGHWSGSGAPYVHADIHDLTFIGSTLYVGNDGGIFASANGGSTWSDKSGNLAIAQLYGIGISQTNANLIIAGHQDNGTTLTSNGTTWAEVNGGDGMLCFIDRANNSQMFSSIYNGALYRSTNGGSSFSSIYTVSGGGWVTPWMQDPVTAATLYAGGTNVVRSTNSGTSWSTISSFTGVGTLVSLDVAKTNAQHIVAASATKVMKTINGGSSWTDITSTLPASSTTSILNVYFDPTNASKIYVGLASYTGQSVFYSADGGATWTNISSGLPSVPANCFVIQNNNGDLYCGTDIGVYLRSAGSSTWTDFTSGMPGLTVRDLEIYEPTAKLRAATFARGIWETPVNSNNFAPTVSITLPVNNATFSVGSNVVINATASDPDGSVAKVEFYQGTTLLSTSTVAPYTYTWVNPAAGSYVLTAKAYDALNAIGTSTPVNITIAIANDAGISAITIPNGAITSATATPSVTLKNFGVNTLTGTTISYQVDANSFVDFPWTGSLASGATTTVTLPSITGYALGTHSFTAKTGLVNGNSDDLVANNSLSSNFTYALPAACANAVTSPYSQNFNAAATLPTGWSNTPAWSFAANHGNTGNGMYKNIWSSVATAQFTMIAVGPLAANDQLAFDYRILDYATSANYPVNTIATPAGWGNIQVQISTDCGLTYTTFYTINDANHVVTKNWATKGVPLSAYAGQTAIFRVIANRTTGDWYIDVDNINIGNSCTGSPSAGTAAASVASACVGTNVTLSTTGASTGLGITYQWQTSADNGLTWSNISGATSTSSTVVFAGTAQYKLVATCTGNPVGISNTVTVTASAPSDCYCVPTYVDGCTNGLDVITRVQLGALDNTTATECGVGNYNYYNAATIPNLPQAVQQSLTIFFGNDVDQFTGAWIDYNQNGVFETTEYLGGNSVTAGSNGIYIINFTVPANAVAGQTRLRIRGGEDVLLTSAQACGASSSTYGQTEDYRVNISSSVPCGGSSLTNTTMSNNTTACINEIVSLSLQNSYALTGITYQWQSSLDGSNWTNISGATNATTLQTITAAISFRCAISCAAGVPTNSTPLSIGLKPSTQCYCTPIASCATAFINTVSIGTTTLNNAASGCSNATGTPSSYISYLPSTTTATLGKGNAYALSVTTSTAQIVSAWVDYNQNGSFEAAEWVQVSTATTANTAATVSLNVPTTALSGMTILRVRSRTSGNPNASTDACSTFASGETEDYWINIVPAPNVAPTVCSAFSSVNSTNSGTWLNLRDVNGTIFASVLDNQVMGNISASYMSNGSGVLRTGGGGRQYLDRNYAIQAQTQPTSVATIRFYFTNAEMARFTDGTTMANALITRYPNEVCNPTLPPNGTQSLATITARYPAGATAGYLQADVLGFSAFYIHGGATVIPVEMTSIKAFSEGNVNKIEWVTASEKSLKAFVVERSIDNKQWITIGTTEPKGGAKEAFYSLTDNQPLLLGYYRIRTVELNGSYEVSKIVSVKRFDSKKLAVLNVSPVPTTDGVTIDFSVNKETTITLILTNIVGQVLKTETIKAIEGTNNSVLSLNNLPNGTYLLNISDGETTALKRVVKQ